jgi:DNA-binding response OmpR family regulator
MKKNGKTIVLAEDDELIRTAYYDTLTRAGYEVFLAKNGQEAILEIRKVKPDLILLDIIMPLIDGFEVLAEIKNDKALSAIPVLILSNLGQETDIQKGIELGAVAYMIKANNNTIEVLEKVEQFVK